MADGAAQARTARRGSVGAVLLLLAVAVGAVWGGGPQGAGAQADDDGEYAPEVGVWLHAAGGDALDVYLYDDRGDVESFTAGVARALGAPDPSVDVDPWDPTAASVQLAGRLPDRSDGRLVWSLDAPGLIAVAAAHGHEAVDLYVCAPTIDRTFDARRPPDDPEWVDYAGFDCPSWHLTPADQDLGLTVTLRPDGSRYVERLVVPLALAMAALGLLAAGIAAGLRRTVLPSLRGPALAVAAAAGGAAVLAVPIAAGIIADNDGAVVDLVMAHDLGVPLQVAATVAPGFLAALPPLVLAVMVLRAPVPPFEPRQVAPPPSPYGPGVPPWLAARRPPGPAGTPGWGAPPHGWSAPPPGWSAPPPGRVAPPGPRPAPSGGSDWPLEPPP